MRFTAIAILALSVLATAARGETMLEVGSTTAPRSPDLSSLPGPAQAELAKAGLAESLIRLSGDGRPGAVDLGLRFDPAVLTFVDATLCDSAKGTMLAHSEGGSGGVNLSLISPNGLRAGDLLRLRFRVLGGDTSSALTATAVAHDAETLAEIPLRVEPGEITVAETKLSTLSMESKVLILVFPALAGIFLLIGGIRYARRLRGA